MHSGRQASKGLPTYSGKHSQSPLLQIAFDPHGDGLQGFGGDGGPNNKIFLTSVAIVNLI
jgi:hypothetical protein